MEVPAASRPRIGEPESGGPLARPADTRGRCHFHGGHDSWVSPGWALVPLRLMIGFGFAAHGYAKLGRGPESFAAILAAIGVPEPHLMAWVTSLLELMGGASVMAGAFVVPLSLPLIVVMLTAMFGVHFQYGFSSIRLEAVTPSGAKFGPVGYELNLLYTAGLLALASSGPGRLSVDRFLRTRQTPRK